MTMTRTTIASRFLSLVALLPTVALAYKNCTIDCLHDTQCVRGQANFSWHPVDPASGHDFDFSKEVERDGWHCGCPPGLTGLRCGRHYESCNDGKHVCFNGGQCIATLKDIYQNDQQYCDCPSSVDSQGNVKRFSGKYCEVEVTTQHSRCTEDNNICQNGGTCKTSVDEIDPCDCPDNYVGRMCEFFEPSVPKCNLQCQNGGSCRYGTKEENHTLVLNTEHNRNGNNKEQHNIHVVHENFMYCECPHGFMGVHCETEETLCGAIKCKHGSACVAVENKDNGETTHHCDCWHINKQKRDKGESIQFAGRHCEIKSTSVCHYDDNNQATTFCTHNGTCPEESHEHCGCPSGYHGAHCQFRDNQNIQNQQAANHNVCKLQCKNGGHCRKGTNQDAHVQQLIEKYGSELGAVGLNITYNKDFEHCACPKGYVGIECEYSMKSCGENGEDHPCFHGSTCTMVNDVPTCVCSGADKHAAGIYCQHLANDVCSVKDNLNFAPQKNGNRGFCVNGGVCVTNKDGEAACRCHSQYEGPHCEYSKNSTANQPHDVKNNKEANSIPVVESTGLSGGAKFGVVVAVFLCLGVIAAGVVFYRKKRVVTEDAPPVYPDLDNSLALDDQSLRAAPVVVEEPEPAEGPASPKLDFGPPVDLDGNELKNVELL